MTPAPLRVAHVVATSGSTGVEAHLVTLLAAFDRAEVEPVLFVARPGPLVDRLRARGVRVEEGAPDRKLALGAARELASRWHGRFDLVHAHGPRAAFWAERAARRARLPFVLTLHETRWRSHPPGVKRSLWLWLERGSWQRADAVITVSEAVRRELLERVPELAPRVRVVYASAPLLLEGERLPRANPAASADRPMRLVTVGRLEWAKGYERLFEVVAALQRQGLDLSLDIVGAGRDEAVLRELAVRLGIVGRLRWLGPLVDLPEVLARSHAFVSATRNETFGVAVLEAMAMGLPVVAPAVGGLPELVVDGVTGLLVTPLPESQLPASLATAVLALARDPAGAARMGNAGAERAREVFGPGPFARGVVATYRDVLESPGPGGAGATRPGSSA